ncbi:uncharacterized protein V6R79_023043 [Siganus canaliculatus]
MVVVVEEDEEEAQVITSDGLPPMQISHSCLLTGRYQVISREVETLLILMLYGSGFRRAADGLFAWTVLLRLRGDDGQREAVSQSRSVLPALTGPVSSRKLLLPLSTGSELAPLSLPADPNHQRCALVRCRYGNGRLQLPAGFLLFALAGKSKREWRSAVSFWTTAHKTTVASPEREHLTFSQHSAGVRIIRIYEKSADEQKAACSCQRQTEESRGRFSFDVEGVNVELVFTGSPITMVLKHQIQYLHTIRNGRYNNKCNIICTFSNILHIPVNSLFIQSCGKAKKEPESERPYCLSSAVADKAKEESLQMFFPVGIVGSKSKTSSACDGSERVDTESTDSSDVNIFELKCESEVMVLQFFAYQSFKTSPIPPLYRFHTPEAEQCCGQ